MNDSTNNWQRMTATQQQEIVTLINSLTRAVTNQAAIDNDNYCAQVESDLAAERLSGMPGSPDETANDREVRRILDEMIGDGPAPQSQMPDDDDVPDQALVEEWERIEDTTPADYHPSSPHYCTCCDCFCAECVEKEAALHEHREVDLGFGIILDINAPEPVDPDSNVWEYLDGDYVDDAALEIEKEERKALMDQNDW